MYERWTRYEPFTVFLFLVDSFRLGNLRGFGFGASLSGFAPMIAAITMGYMSAAIGLCLLLMLVGVIGLIIVIIIPNDQVEIRRINCLNNNYD